MQDPTMVYVMGMDPEHLRFDPESQRVLYKGRRFFMQMAPYQMGIWNESNEIPLVSDHPERQWIRDKIHAFLRAIRRLAGGPDETIFHIYCPEPPEDLRVGDSYICVVEPVFSPTDSRKVIFEAGAFEEV